MNRINKLFQRKKDHILSIYLTAGYPTLESAPVIIKALEHAGADMIEIGMPFSDPMADGPVIQASSSEALKNGMSLKVLFAQLKDIRKDVGIPLLLMGYLNPVLQYGMERFCFDCRKTGIDGIILPDLPMDVYKKEYAHLFDEFGLTNIFLITPQTKEERILQIDKESKGFIYMVSSSSTTGVKGDFSSKQTKYFERVARMKLQNPIMAGFGISNNNTFETVSRYVQGAIIGSAFVNFLQDVNNIENDIKEFVLKIRG